MSVNALKLTSYFGEHDRAGHRLLADDLLDLCGQRRVAASILLRGVEGFGAKHTLRTDRLLTLSEDLPVVAVAIDTAPTIEALRGELEAIGRPGLLTVERAALITGTNAGQVEQALHEQTKLTIYLPRHARRRRRPLFMSVCELLHREGFAGATVLLGVDGTARGSRERAALFGGNSAVPTMVVSVGNGERIAALWPALTALIDDPVVTIERVQVCKRDGVLAGPPPRQAGGWLKLMVHASESARHDGHPLHRSLVRELRRSGIAGATTLRGIWGFHGDHPPHGDRPFQRYRHVPTVTIVIDTAERISDAFAVIDKLTVERGLVTCEAVPVKYPA